MTNSSEWVHLRRGGTSVVIDLSGDSGGRQQSGAGVPVIVHWGVDLGDLSDDVLGDLSDDVLGSLCEASLPQRVSGSLDFPARLSLLPLESQGWQHEPGLIGSGAHDARLPLLTTRSTTLIDDDADLDTDTDADANLDLASATGIDIELVDTDAGLEVLLELRLSESGLLRQRAIVRNTAEDDYTVQSLTLSFPVPVSATEILDTTGRHLKERSPQRHDFVIGEHVRNSRRGRPGADASLLMLAGARGFGFRRGVVHGIHVAWSGNHHLAAIRTPAANSYLSGGELLQPGEGVLAAGATYSTPWVVGSWGDGLDELSARFHDDLRARPHHPSSPRPVTLNTWEAVYFDQDLAHLARLAARAAEIGVERFVLDDGWFMGRRDDTAGLGDWYVDPAVWPDGLTPLIDHVTRAGMQFGLWVEPEMVNPDSALAREHPGWILRPRTRWPVASRGQFVLNLANPDAFAYIFERLDSLLTEYDIAYLKWDHNRDLLEAVDQRTGQVGVHDTTAALYLLLDQLRAKHPSVEIESCASGGARVDLGILDRTDRIWVSDCIDPIERLDNQAYTNLLVPYELMGAHVGAPTSHSTHRSTGLDFQAGVALFGHFGIEWDISLIDERDADRLAEWVSFYRQNRDLFHSGHSVHNDVTDASLDIRGVVSRDRSRALYAVIQRSASVGYPVGRVTLPGLEADGVYSLRVTGPGARDGLSAPGQSPLGWATAAEPRRFTGRMLGDIGVQAPVQYPQSLVLVEALRVS